MNRKCGAVLLAALILMLVIAGSAYAEGEKVLLDHLFPNSSPSKAAKQLVVPINLSKSEGPYSFTVDELLFDGSGLYVTWTARSNSDDLVIFSDDNLQSPSVKFKDQGVSQLDLPRTFFALGGTLNGKSIPQEYKGFSSARLKGGDTLDPFDVSIRCFFLKPVARIVNKSDITADFSGCPTWSVWTGGDQPSFNFLSGAKFDRDGNYSIETEGFTKYLDGCNTYDELVNAYMTGLTELGYAQPPTEIEMTLTVNPDAKHIQHTGIEGQSTFDFDSLTVVINKADFTVASYDVEMVMIEKDDTKWAKLGPGISYMLYADDKRLSEEITTNSQYTIGKPRTEGMTYAGKPLPKAPSYLLFEAWGPGLQYDMSSIGSGVTIPLIRLPALDIKIKLARNP